MTEQIRAVADTLARLWTGREGHLTEDQLVAMATGESSTPDLAEHVAGCPRCEAALVETTDALDVLRDAANDGFDEVYTADRLQSQRRRISHRLATLVGTEAPAKVIRFPFSGRPLPQLAVRTGRWVGVATAAGLVLGVSAGQLVHFHAVPADQPGLDTGVTMTEREQPLGPTYDMTGTVELPPLGDGLATPADAGSSLSLDEFDQIEADEEFLINLDLALTSFPVAELESIDALTPRVRDFSVDIR